MHPPPRSVVAYAIHEDSEPARQQHYLSACFPRSKSESHCSPPSAHVAKSGLSRSSQPQRIEQRMIGSNAETFQRANFILKWPSRGTPKHLNARPTCPTNDYFGQQWGEAQYQDVLGRHYKQARELDQKATLEEIERVQSSTRTPADSATAKIFRHHSQPWL
jgi:hypothetical protein